MKRVVWGTAAISLMAVLSVAGYMAIAPQQTLAEIKTAVNQRDPVALAERVDFDLLRHNLKQQLAASVAESLGGNRQSPLSEMAMSLAKRVADGAVDYFITPEGLAMLMKGERLFEFDHYLDRHRVGDAATRPVTDDVFRGARLTYDSLDQVSVWVPNEDDELIRLVLQRQGLSWKLVDLRLPSVTDDGVPVVRN